MKTSFRSTSELPALRRIVAGVMLCCAMATTMPPALAQENSAALSFVNADIESVIKAVGHYTGMTFIIDPRVKGTLTLVSEKSLTKSQAFGLLTSALRLQGFAVVTTGEGYAKVVPEAEAKLQSSPTQVGKRGTRVQGDQIATQIFHLSYESAANLTAVLRPLISPNNSIMANPGNNSLVITDYADNLRRLARIIAALDAPVAADLDVVPIRNGIASDIATLVSRLMEPAAGGDSGRVTILADARTNSVVVRAPSQARANLAKSLIAKLDQATTEKGNIHVVYLKNADASKVAQTLRAVVSQDASAVPVQQQGTAGGSIQAGSQGGANTGSGGLGSQQGQQGGIGAGGSSSNYSQQGQATAGGAGGGAGSGFIQADASTNSLIITAPDAIYRNLRGVIDQLDVRRAQVYIEAMVVEMNASKAAEFGVQWLGLSGSDTSKYRIGGIQSFNSGASNNIVNLAAAARAGVTGESGVPSLPGLTLGIFKQINGELGLGAVASALENEGAANILSTPNMITLDNELATIKVGRNIPILTGSFTTGTNGSNNPFQTVDRKDIGLLMKVRPQISEGGVIKLSIYHENSDIDNTLERPEGIVTTLRAIESNILADDGQIIVLGGLISDNENHQQEKVRGLGDIPVVGNLFKYRTRTREKTNLMVFLRPVVVRSKEQNNSISLDRYEYMRALGATTRPQDDTVLLRNLGAPELPPLINGQPPAGGTFATMPPPAPPPVRPGAATGPGVSQPAAPQSTQPYQAPVPEFRPVQPSNQK
ncbi:MULTISPECIES: type II secretion system secretin GspD [unclassified Massilia]|uniref:type II secretion system secretin GspD n=1 Tax=unclassified Massilia TaxID=2609279 RepID=UPI0017873078|nr:MULTISPECIES: type II secretion system secretin GspD [unclassified Massilia]MBD8532389.1 type II secretion system secretin GspD [Massilia sp. CFBP 13647]MBD8675785.1 type II secretion system secretin GspD [Massilia sp. CFBP 13721]